jgi:hypothetical protein
VDNISREFGIAGALFDEGVKLPEALNRPARTTKASRCLRFFASDFALRTSALSIAPPALKFKIQNS